MDVARDFAADLAESHRAIEGTDLLSSLRMRFPNVIRIEKASEQADRLGTDYWLHRRRGSPISIDLKIRNEDCRAYGVDDLCLELWSAKGKQVGWTLDTGKATDYVGWYWRDTERLYVAPFAPLHASFARYRDEWTNRFGTKAVSSWHLGSRYVTECIFVPCATLEKAMAEWAGGFPTTQQLII